MARTVRVGEFQSMQRAGTGGPSHVALGEADALGDAEQSGHDVASVDPMTGQLVDAGPSPSVAEQLADLEIHVSANPPYGEVVRRLKVRADLFGIPAGASDIETEARRRCGIAADGEAPEQRVAEILAEKHGRGLHDGMTIGGCPSCEPPVEPKPDWRDIVKDRGLVADVNPDGTLAGLREPEMTPDRGPDVGTTVHTVTDDEPRFSGAGADDSEASGLVPNDSDFHGKLYRDAPELANIAEELIQRHGFLEDLEHCDVRWYWKRKTGVSKGRVKIGFMKRASDLLGHFSGADFIGWLSATTARDGKFTSEQVEAAVFHQLLHIGSDDKGNWIFMPHDFEGFGQEVRHYGTWTEGLKLGGTAFAAAQQMGLFDATDEDEDDEDEDDGEDVAGEVIEQVFGDEPADPDRPFDDEHDNLPTAEDDPLADPSVI
jgi:hypothetical protein